MALPNVTDLKAHANMTGTADDDELQDHLDAAIEIVEGIIGPLGHTEEAVTEIHRGVNSDRIILRQMPASAIASVSTRYGLTTTAQTLEDYELDTDTGIVRSIYGAQFYGDFVIEYTAGNAALPASIKLAVLIIAAHLWETQRVPGVNRFGTPDEPGVPTGFAIPNRARELLAPYQSVGLA